MEWLATNWDTIITLINSIGLMLIAKRKKGSL